MTDADQTGPPQPTRLWTIGRTAWALLGIAAVVLALGYVASAIAIVLIPTVLALFPATLLAPIADRLCRRGVSPGLSALLTLLLGLVVFFGVLAGAIALVIAQLPELLESAAEGVGQIEGFLEDDPLGIGVEGFADVADLVQEQLGEAGDLAPQAATAAVFAVEFVVGLLLMFVVLFFYLKDGRRLRDAIVTTFPRARRPVVGEALDRSWDTLSGYLRGQLLVAAVDAFFIGVGLVILGVPLALPLAILVLFGGLFPIVGAVVTGALAVLVALADGGLTTGLIVAGIVLAVQQLESNVLEPYILGRSIRLHPLVVLTSIAAAASVFGILGAFLAVPAAAITARVVDLLRDRDEATADAGAG
ncbi:AI-2E family transporter [Nitriliruptor alkaliphilus]|uniref:AI-2E family transporter n=1 Tax=Nitriliruptor alkaliphilus TaxID=427918 RepID=UPI0006967D2A|nr:AI-2E family transporter [Nitriliruptor alkaliphilus]